MCARAAETGSEEVEVGEMPTSTIWIIVAAVIVALLLLGVVIAIICVLRKRRNVPVGSPELHTLAELRQHEERYNKTLRGALLDIPTARFQRRAKSNRLSTTFTTTFKK